MARNETSETAHTENLAATKGVSHPAGNIVADLVEAAGGKLFCSIALKSVIGEMEWMKSN